MAERELVGYTVAVNRPSSRDPGRWDIVGSVHSDRLPAENHQAYCEASAEADPKRYGTDVRYEVVEVWRPTGDEESITEPGQAVTHLAVIQASLPPGLTEVAGGTEQHCRAALEEWVRGRGLRDGEQALIVAVVAETVAEPGVGVYTVPAGPQ